MWTEENGIDLPTGIPDGATIAERGDMQARMPVFRQFGLLAVALLAALGAIGDKKALEPLIAALKDKHPEIPVIAFPREAGERYEGFAKATGADCVALDNSVDAAWAAAQVRQWYGKDAKGHQQFAQALDAGRKGDAADQQ